MTLLEKYESLNFTPSNFLLEAEGKEYKACKFQLSSKKTLGRTAKLTPKKKGLFVTLWKRNEEGVTAPFDKSDTLDFVIVLVQEHENSGYFKFPTEILIQKGIFASRKKAGKRGFRIYPPWSKDLNNQAKSSQDWQIQYFTESFQKIKS